MPNPGRDGRLFIHHHGWVIQNKHCLKNRKMWFRKVERKGTPHKAQHKREIFLCLGLCEKNKNQTWLRKEEDQTAFSQEATQSSCAVNKYFEPLQRRILKSSSKIVAQAWDIRVFIQHQPAQGDIVYAQCPAPWHWPHRCSPTLCSRDY